MLIANVCGSIYRKTVTLGCHCHVLLSFCLIFSFSMTFNGSTVTSMESEVMYLMASMSLSRQTNKTKGSEADGGVGREIAPLRSPLNKDCHASFVLFLR